MLVIIEFASEIFHQRICFTAKPLMFSLLFCFRVCFLSPFPVFSPQNRYMKRVHRAVEKGANVGQSLFFFSVISSTRFSFIRNLTEDLILNVS